MWIYKTGDDYIISHPLSVNSVMITPPDGKCAQHRLRAA